MKTKQIIKIALSLLLFIGVFTSCVDDKDFDTPQVLSEDNDISTSDITAVKNALIQEYEYDDPSTLIYTFPEDSPVVIAGYVIGDDSSGNYYKELVVQNSPENPIAGVEIDIDQSNLSSVFNVGRKIYIKMAGLSIAYFDGSQGPAPGYINQSEPGNSTPGIYKIGVRGDDFSLDRISSTDFNNYIIRSSVTETIIPKTISSDDFNDDNMNTYVQLNDMQFELGELGKTFSGEATDSFDAERILLSCDTDATFGLMTSTFSNFKSIQLPSDKGTLKGVMTKNYRENDPVIVLNSYQDLDFTDTERCDPPLFCNAEAVGGSTVVFDMDFENISDESELIGLGWTNVNANGGSNTWEYRTYNNNGYMQLGAYNSNEDPLEGWLVTPAINLDSSTDEALTFDANVGYHNGNAVTVYASTDFTGDVATATWTLIENVTLPTGPSSGYGDFAQGGNINISCLDGDVYFAFKYLGADGGITTTFQIDNVKVTGN